MITARLTGLALAVGAFERELDDHLDAALAEISRRVASEAQASHGFENRTGNLEGSIRSVDTFGSALDGTLAGGVVADESYAGYVNDRMPFLEPAWQRIESGADEMLERALEEASRAAGW